MSKIQATGMINILCDNKNDYKSWEIDITSTYNRIGGCHDHLKPPNHEFTINYCKLL